MKNTSNTVEEMLRRRGHTITLSNPTDYLLFPPDFDKPFEDELYGMLRKYSFRIFIRDVIRLRKSFRADDLLKYSTREWVDRYLDFILKRGLIEETRSGNYRLKSEAVFSFGDTLEWFVANIFKEEFDSSALWGVRLGDISAGGDYDVVAAVEGSLVYVEVKSSPPKNVEEPEVAAFIRRTEALRPGLAIFLEDTRLRMKDKIVPIFEGLLKNRGLEVSRVRDETFVISEKGRGKGRLYITNSKPDMITNIALCVRRHLVPEDFWKGS